MTLGLILMIFCRRVCIMILSVVDLIGWIFIAASQNLAMMLIGRFISGTQPMIQITVCQKKRNSIKSFTGISQYSEKKIGVLIQILARIYFKLYVNMHKLLQKSYLPYFFNFVLFFQDLQPLVILRVFRFMLQKLHRSQLFWYSFIILCLLRLHSVAIFP